MITQAVLVTLGTFYASLIHKYSSTLVIMGTTMQSLTETLQTILAKESLHFVAQNNTFYIDDKKLNITIEQSKFQNIFYLKYTTKEHLRLYQHITRKLHSTAIRNEMAYIKPSYTTRLIFCAIRLRALIMCALWLALCAICVPLFY